MLLSTTTLILFISLVPGFVLRQSIFFVSPIKKPLGELGPLQAAISILVYSTLSVLSLLILAVILEQSINGLRESSIPIGISSQSSALNIHYYKETHTILSFLIAHPFVSAAVYVGSLLIVGLIGALGSWIVLRSRSLSKFFYGPFADIVHPSSVTLCSVLTKIGNESRRLVYSGFVIEIGIGSGNSIEHIILDEPSKFFLTMEGDEPSSTIEHARSLSLVDTNRLFISNASIENVHFDVYVLRHE